MAGKAKRFKVVIVVLTVALSLAVVCFVDSLRYPRIARSAYWRHPHLLVRATSARLFPGKGVSKEAVVGHARRLGRIDDVDARLVYLSNRPTDDKTIKARVLGLIAKGWTPSKEQLFWLVTPYRNGRSINDDRLVYEYRTGRLICAKEYDRLGEFARE
jgi:hypothetical protein